MAAVLAEVGGPGRQGRAAAQAAQPHLGKAHDAARVRGWSRQRNAPRMCSYSTSATVEHPDLRCKKEAMAPHMTLSEESEDWACLIIAA